MICFQLFLNFFKIGLFSFGGGYSAIALIENIAVEKFRWLSPNELNDLIVIAEMTPGPITVNAATFVGMRVGGIIGVISATLGCILPSCLLSSLVAVIYMKWRGSYRMKSILVYLKPAAIALIASAGISVLSSALFPDKIISFSRINWMKASIFVLAFMLLRFKKAHPVFIMCLCAGIYMLLSLFTQ